MTIDVDYLSRYLVGTAGGYLANAVRGDGHCEVCTTPIDPPWTACVHCNRHRQLPYTASLADLVVPLTYAGHNRQSERLVYGYKNPLITGEPSDDSVSAHRLTMSLLIFLGLAFHRPCIERVTGPVDALAVIPSTKGRPDHPLAGLIGPTAVEQSLPLIDLSYIGPLGDSSRDIHPERWTTNDVSVINGRHILVIDDSWVTGRHPQSVAAALKRDGADRVTVLVAARLLERKWEPTKRFLERTPLPDYDPHRCPVTIDGICVP
ncbi:MAG: phosphoribosyltransferase [Candidatus Nanopelagicales bacterium]